MAEFPPDLRHFSRKGNPNVVEVEDIEVAERIVRRFLSVAVREYRALCMRESFTEASAYHTVRLTEMQRAHISRVRWNGGVLVRHLIANRLPEGVLSSSDGEALANRARVIDLALLLHDLFKMDPRQRWGVNARHIESTCNMTRAICSEILHKGERLVEQIKNAVEIAGSPVATPMKRTGMRDPKTLDEAIIFGANNLDYADYWGTQFIVWVRQHPQFRIGAEEREGVSASLFFARRIRDEASGTIYRLKLLKEDPEVLAPLKNFGLACWKRSQRFFKHAEELHLQTFKEFRRAFARFLENELHGDAERPRITPE